MTSLINASIIAMGIGRIALGLAPFVAPVASSKLLGFPVAHDNPTTRLMARMFGVRDVGLGLIAFFAVAHPELRAPIFLFQAATDAGDLIAIGNALVRRQGIDRAAWRSAAFAAFAIVTWMLQWVVDVAR